MKLTGVDSGQFRHQCTNFGDIEFGHPNSIIVVQKNNNKYFKMFFLLILSLTKTEEALLPADVHIHHITQRQLFLLTTMENRMIQNMF